VAQSLCYPRRGEGFHAGTDAERGSLTGKKRAGGSLRTGEVRKSQPARAHFQTTISSVSGQEDGKKGDRVGRIKNMVYGSRSGDSGATVRDFLDTRGGHLQTPARKKKAYERKEGEDRGEASFISVTDVTQSAK